MGDSDEGSSSRLMSQRPGSLDGGRNCGRRPAGAVVVVAPGDAAEIDGVEQQCPDVDVLAVRGRGHLLGDLALGRAGRPEDDGRLAGLDQEGEHLGELARAQRVVRGNVVGNGHGATSGSGKSARRGLSRDRPAAPAGGWPFYLFFPYEIPGRITGGLRGKAWAYAPSASRLPAPR